MRLSVLTLAVALAAPAAAVEPAPPTATSTPTSAPTSTSAATATPPQPSPPLTPATPPPAAPSPAALEKLALGDRAFAAGDVRGALFAYQDAVYLEPGSAAARLKLGRAYLALRYPAQAQGQAEQVLAVDPANAEARSLLDECRAAPPRATAAATPAAPAPRIAPPAPAPAEPAPPAAASPTIVLVPQPSAPPRTPARVYRLQPEPDPAAAEPGRPAPAVISAVPVSATGAEPAAAGATAADRYRAGVKLIGEREYARAIRELDDAVALDPRLAVAYAARASAHFGLQRWRDAARDYEAALALRPELGTPVYGLAECFRMLEDPRAAELYRRYAESAAPDVRPELREVAAQRAAAVAGR